MRYRLQAGSFAWIVHRVTGISLTLYILPHLYVLSHLRDPLKYEALMGLMTNPFIRLGEAGLLGLVIGHAFNGFRLILIDLGVSTRFQRPLFWVACLLGGLLFVVGAWPLVRGSR